MAARAQAVLCLPQQNLCHSEAPPVRGHIVTEALRPGLTLHSTDIQVLRRQEVRGEATPGLRLILMLQGRLQARFGRRELTLDASTRPQGVLLPLAQSEPLCRPLPAGEVQRQVVVTVEPCWFDEGGYAALADHAATRALCGRHLAPLPLRADAELCRLGHALTRPTGQTPALERLQHECRTLELLLAALAQQAPPTLTPAERRRADTLARLLDGGGADGWTLARMARELGSNPTTLQRQFQARHGLSIGEYLRRSRLARARALLQEGASVTEAALAAGYGSAANFATAFRRHYGLRPSEVNGRRGPQTQKALEQALR